MLHGFHHLQSHHATDQVDKCERCHRKTKRFNGLRDGVWGDAGFNQAKNFTEECRQQAVDDKTRFVSDDHGSFPKGAGDVNGCGQGRSRLSRSTNNLNKFHRRDGVEEMNPRHSVGVRHKTGHGVNGQRRRIGRNDRVGPYNRVQLGKDCLFDREVFENGFNDEITVSKTRHRQGRM